MLHHYSYHDKGNEDGNRGIKPRSPAGNTRKTRKTELKRYIRNTEAGYVKEKKKTMNQFKQLLNQTLRFIRATSSPTDRMAQMRSNKRYNPWGLKRWSVQDEQCVCGSHV